MNISQSRAAMLAAVDAAILAAPAAAVSIKPIAGRIQCWEVLLTGASETVLFRKFNNGLFGVYRDARGRLAEVLSGETTLSGALLAAAGLPVDYVTITARGCGRYRVLNTRERLAEFRADCAREFSAPRITANIRASRPVSPSLTCSEVERSRVMAMAELVDA